MKKMIIAIMGVVCGLTIVVNGINTINYQTKIADLEKKVESLEKTNDYIKDEYNALESDKEELDSQVYNMMNGEEYEFTVNHGNGTYTYKAEGKGLFKHKSMIGHEVTSGKSMVISSED